MSNYRNLEHQAHPQNQLNWGTEPTGYKRPIPPGAGPLPLANSIIPITFGARVSGASGTYPNANRVAVQSFTTAIGLLSASLSTSIINVTSDSPYVIVVSRDVGANLNVNNSTDMLVEHVCEQTLGHSFRSGVGFADDIAPKYGSGEKIGIYVCSSGTGVAGNVATMIVTLRYFPLLPSN
jgi:hypothetical protein